MKKIAQYLTAGIRELWIVENSLYDVIFQKKNDQLRENKLYNDSGI